MLKNSFQDLEFSKQVNLVIILVLINRALTKFEGVELKNPGVLVGLV